MIKKYSRYMVVVVLLALAACGSAQEKESGENEVIISGTVGYPQQGAILLEEYVGTQPMVRDTIELAEDYTFAHSTEVERPGYYRLNFYNKQFVNVILHDADIEVNVDGNARNGFMEVNGSPEIDFINKVQTMTGSFQNSENVQKINQLFQQATANGDEEAVDSLRVAYFDLEDQFKKQIIAAIDSLGPSLGAVEVLRSGQVLDRDKYFGVYKRYAQQLKEHLPHSPIAMDFVKEVENMGKLAIGQVAPDIALPNPDGEIVKLSSLRGNYVLVDFWAKWCKPCRMENPNVVRMFNKYHDKGFEVYGVSLDRKREDWLQAIEQDGLHWTQVSDLKYWNSEAAELYNIKSIPFALLLDPEGVIIGKNLRGSALEAKLEEIFSQQ